jgi:raffinose/stachyose/melibiose transport system permease protein
LENEGLMSKATTALSDTAQGQDGTGRRRSARRSRSRDRTLADQRNELFWPFVLPALSVYALLMLVPTVATVYISLNKWRAQGDPMIFAGVKNYTKLVGNAAFRTSFVNTLEILLLCGVVVFVLAFAITMAMREMRGRRLAQAMLFFPYLISPVVIAIGLGLALNPAGAVDRGLTAANLEFLAKHWLDPQHIFFTLVLTVIWVSTGFYVLLIMAGVDRIPRYFYEDTDLAGANAWQKFWHVTLPLTWDVVTIAAVLWVVNAVKIFELILAFSSAGDAPPLESRTLAVQQYYVTVGGRYPVYDMGSGAAIGVVTLLLVAILVIVLRRLMRRERVEF